MNVGRVKKDGPVLKLDRRGEKVPKKWNVRLGAVMAGCCYSYRFASLKPGQRTAHFKPCRQNKCWHCIFLQATAMSKLQISLGSVFYFMV